MKVNMRGKLRKLQFRSFIKVLFIFIQLGLAFKEFFFFSARGVGQLDADQTSHSLGLPLLPEKAIRKNALQVLVG